MSSLWNHDLRFDRPICGIDEVGRGPLAGPVTAACVHIPAQAINKAPALLEMTDSKKLSAKKRDMLTELIKEHCIWGLADIFPQEIDKINILQATFEAMRRAAHSMLQAAPELQNSLALIDGNKIPPRLGFHDTESIIKGDGKSLHIAAASILAKTKRDQYMQGIAIDYPQYGWESNAGYGSAKHRQAIEELGATPHHRMSFAPLKYMV
jgi:ribonuclease HII